MSIALLISIYLEARPLSDSAAPLNREMEINLRLEIADSESERSQGLSGRESLADDTGMLFIFDSPSYPGFWMKDMHFALDFVWINSDWQIVQIDRDVQPDTYPQIFTPNSAVRYVLEINSGKANELGLEVSDVIKLPQLTDS